MHIKHKLRSSKRSIPMLAHLDYAPIRKLRIVEEVGPWNELNAIGILFEVARLLQV